MYSVITDYPRYTEEIARKQWDDTYKAAYDTYDKQNDYNAKLCFLRSLEENLHKDIKAKIDKGMTFPEIFLISVQHEIPVSHEKYESIERSIITFDVKQYQGNNVTAMVTELRRMIKTLVTARMWDSKNNSQLCCTLIDAGGSDNQEYTSPMYAMLGKIKKEITKTGHMNNDDKIAEMTKQGVGWKDLLGHGHSWQRALATGTEPT